jgi:Zn-dependent peptidase ImmA (M78 family)
MSKISKVYELILERLPSTYPHAELIIHNSLKKLCQTYWKGESKKTSANKDDDPFCFCDGVKNTIHTPKCLNKSSCEEISWYLLHEVGHLFALQKYGFEDYRWDGDAVAERYANEFATKWNNKIKKERLFEKLNKEAV